MTIQVNLEEAQQQFAQLFSQVLQGEEIIIIVDGQERARLTPTKPTLSSDSLSGRIPGIDEGRFVVPDDFDDPLPPDILQAFTGES